MKKVLIIAEAGVNHNGSVTIARKLIDVAADSGVDYVKFQTFKTEQLVIQIANMASYQNRNINSGGNSQYAMLKKLELSPAQNEGLINYCSKKKIRFLSSAFDLNSVDYLHRLNLGLWKIPSGEITNYPYIKKIAQYDEPVILSTGMCEMQDIENAVDTLLKWGTKKRNISILHCNTDYPTPYQDANLRAMESLRQRFGVEVGYSDHTNGIEVPIAAVALGATIIEKHFTLDRNMEGPDHKASLEPGELKAMVTAIRNIELAIGDGIKKVTDSEKGNISVARKSIVAARNIKRGEVFTEENLAVKRPGTGISPMRWEEILGQKAHRDYLEEDLIEL